MKTGFRQEHLPQLSLHYTSVAESLGQRTQLRLPRIVDLARRDDGAIRWVGSNNGGRPLKGLLMLAKLRDFGEFQGNNNDISRYNVGTVARLGGLAAESIYRSTQSRRIKLSPAAMGGLTTVLVDIHQRMLGTLEPAMREVPPDREAFYFLNAAGRMLGATR